MAKRKSPPAKNNPETNLVWLDMEMTGLNINIHTILEVAVIVTDSELNILDEGIEIVIHQPKRELNEMDDWNLSHHTRSGLLAKVQTANDTMNSAERKVLDYIAKYTMPHTAPLCGSSIWHDRTFVRKYMPNLDNYLHYRIIDVSSIRELAVRWYANLSRPTKQDRHRALDDIKDSIAELKYFRESIFKKKLISPKNG